MTKPINFRPSEIDAALIDALKKEKGIDVTADVIRAAIQHYAVINLDPAIYADTVLSAYEQDVSG